MMAKAHALSAAVAYLALAPVIGGPTDPVLLAVGAGVATGAGMLPDLDCPGSAIARTYGFVTNALARAIAAVSGGHRNGTHSLVGIIGLTAAATLAAAVGGWYVAVVLWILLGVAARAAGLVVPAHRRLTSLIHAAVMAGVVYVVVSTGYDIGPVVPAAVLVGCVAHVAGDMLTTGGVPLGWPLSKARQSLGLMRTDSAVERVLVVPALIVALIFLLAT